MVLLKKFLVRTNIVVQSHAEFRLTLPYSTRDVRPVIVAATSNSSTMASTKSWDDLVTRISKLNTSLNYQQGIDSRSVTYAQSSESLCQQTKVSAILIIDNRSIALLCSTRWTPFQITSYQSNLAERMTLIERALELHKLDKTSFSSFTLQTQNHNFSPVFRLPDDVLFLVFLECVARLVIEPELLASVCSRWRTLVHGDTGVKLWSFIDVRISTRAEVVRTAERVAQVIERSKGSSKLTLKLRDVSSGYTSDLEPGDIALLRSVTSSCVERAEALYVCNITCFEDWLPLGMDGSSLKGLKHLHITGPGWESQRLGDGVSDVHLLSSACPAMRFFSLLLDSDHPLYQPPNALSLLMANLSKHAPSITHMHIHASSEVDEVFIRLKDFQYLEYLRWGWTNNSIETEPPSPDVLEPLPVVISLPKLKTLVVEGSTIIQALCGNAGSANDTCPILDAPSLSLLYLSDWEPSHTLPCFPSLRAFTCDLKRSQMDSGSLRHTMELEFNKIECLTYNLSASLLASWLSELCSFLRTFHIPGDGGEGFDRIVKGTSSVLNIACSDIENLSAYEAEILHQLKSMLVQRKVVIGSLSFSPERTSLSLTSSGASSTSSHPESVPTPKSTSPSKGFMIGLSTSILDASTSIRELVQVNRGVLRSFVLPEPPAIYDVVM